MAVVLYHNGCSDGFGAAWIASKFLEDPKLIPVSYGKPAPLADLRNEIVYIVDFSYPRAELVELASVAHRVIVLDHHKSAEKELMGLDVPMLHIEFDMKRSGCRMTWDYFHARRWRTVKRPNIFDTTRLDMLSRYIQDRDLWTWELKDSREVSAYIAALPKTIEWWDVLLSADWENIAVRGHAVLLHIKSQVETMTRESEWAIGRFRAIEDVAIINICVAAPGSEILHILCQSRPFAVGWAQSGDGSFYYSLRSDVDGADVGALAASLRSDHTAFAGGGHARAAGFSSWLCPNELFTGIVPAREPISS